MVPQVPGRQAIQPWLCPIFSAMLALTGCQQSAAVPAAGLSPTQPATAGIVASQATDQQAPLKNAVLPAGFGEPPPDNLAGGKLVEETWDAFSMQGTRVGYCRTTIANVNEGGRQLVRTCSFTRTVMQRAGDTVKQDMILTSWDTPDGQLVRFESRLSAGPGEIVAVGAVNEGQLGIDVTTLGRTQSQKIPWQADWCGIFASDQSLRRQPLKPGEKRSVRGLLPILNIPGDAHLEGVEYETVDLPVGKTQLLKVNSVIDLGAQKIESVIWINNHGETLKSLVPSIGQEAVRTTREDALSQSASGQFDLLLASTVPLKGELTNPQLTKRVVYRARMKSGKIAGLFPDGPTQQVEPIDDQSAEITVVSIRPSTRDSRTPNPGPRTPPAADLAPSNFIQSDDPQIAEIAARVAPAETDAWMLACALEKFVDGAIQQKNFSQAFATAAEVARSREGDCTEHAVLMAALCRARKIPARVAFGLVYYPPEKGFAYHMWNEAWIADRWIPLDPTLGLGGIGADHIKLGDSNLASGSPLADLLSVIQVFGRLELEVISAE